MAVDPKNVLRLNLPQWQGSDRPDYRIGGRVLAAIAPDPQGPQETVPVPVSTSGKRPVEGGIVSRAALLEQIAAARLRASGESSGRHAAMQQANSSRYRSCSREVADCELV